MTERESELAARGLEYAEGFVDPPPAETPQHGTDHEEGFTFLGRYELQGVKYDLWHGPEMASHLTIVARWSPEGGDYSSGMCFGWMNDRPDHPLVVARQRAQARGLDVQRELYEGKMVRLSASVIAFSPEEAALWADLNENAAPPADGGTPG